MGTSTEIRELREQPAGERVAVGGVVHETSKRWGYQQVILEECPADTPSGEEPERVAVRVEGNLIGEMESGDHVTVEGFLFRSEDEPTFIEAAKASVAGFGDDEQVTAEKIRERLGW